LRTILIASGCEVRMFRGRIRSWVFSRSQSTAQPGPPLNFSGIKHAEGEFS
jgi:hypothetical protein